MPKKKNKPIKKLKVETDLPFVPPILAQEIHLYIGVLAREEGEKKS